MKVNKRMAVRGGAALVSLLGLVSASAFLITSTNTTDTVSGDSAIVLKWGETNSIANITSLTPSAPAYRSVTGSWTKSSSVTGFAKFTFKLTTENKIKVRISNKSFSESGFKDENDLLSTLFDSVAPTTYTHYVSLDAACPTYYLEISTLDNKAGEVSGTLTVSLDYSETNNA